LVSTLVTLVLTPSLFTLTLEMKSRILKRFGSKECEFDDLSDAKSVDEPSVAAQYQ
jgi:hypothetical protein